MQVWGPTSYTIQQALKGGKFTSYASLSSTQMLWPSSPKKSGWHTFVADLFEYVHIMHVAQSKRIALKPVL
jgi:hypothetical protein